MTPSSSPAIGTGLSSLTWPIRSADFRNTYWQRRCLVNRGGSSRLRRLLRVLGPLDLGSLISLAAPIPILAWLEDANGRYISTSVLPSSAHALYQAGATLYFHLRPNPYLQAWKSSLASQLGVTGVQLSLFVGKKGTGTRLHFDANDNFTVQLLGEKTWSLHRNDSVREPTQNWVPSTEVPGELRYYCPEDLEREVPRTARRVTLAPGSVLYVPRGHWHGTVSRSDAISLNICLPPVSWARLVADKLYAYLLTEERWRRSSGDLDAGGIRRKRADRELAGLLRELPTLAAGLETTDMMPSQGVVRLVPPHLKARLVRPRLARWFIINTGRQSPEQDMVTFCSPTGQKLTVVMDRDMMRVVRKIERQGHDVFSLGMLADPAVPRAELQRLVDTLIKTGFFRLLSSD